MTEPKPSSKITQIWDSTTKKGNLCNRCIGCWSRRKSFVSKGLHVVLKEQSTWQCSPVVNSIDVQEPNTSSNLLKQHRKGNPRYTPWSSKFHHYCFAHGLNMVTDHKLLITILRKMQNAYHRDCKEYCYTSFNKI